MSYVIKSIIPFPFQKPVVILKSDMVKSTEKWDLEYLEKNMGNSDFTVFQSRNHKFKFFDDKKAAQLLNNNKIECQPNMKRINMKLSEFCQRLKQWKRGDERFVFENNIFYLSHCELLVVIIFNSY